MGVLVLIGQRLNFLVWSYINLFFLNLYFDWARFLFLTVLFIIVGRVLFFRVDYMVGEEPRFNGFVSLILVFVAAMVVLIVSGDWLRLILGWDWLGISSFFLVAYYKSEQGWVGRMKTYFTNRLGDGVFMFLLRILLFSFFFRAHSLKKFFLFFIVLLCQTKRAQIPFCAWLPAAMAAPTPVSSLVHSSTLVTAGVFILIRKGCLLNPVSFYVGVVGLLTLFIGGFSACGSFDIKKIVAFSTLSHLGFMFICFSGGSWIFRFFHLLCHASFKALLFIRAGMLIIGKAHSQDFRQIGVSYNKLFYIWCRVVRVLSLFGFPYFSGYFSKDYIIENLIWGGNSIFLFIFIISIFFSSFYSFRLVFSFLNVNWGVLEKEPHSSGSFYILFLLIFRRFLGLFTSKYFFSFRLVMRDSLFKIFIYSIIIVGALMSFNRVFPCLSESISFLDSLGGGLKNSVNLSFFNTFKALDHGVLPLIVEKWGLSKIIFHKNWGFSSKIFYYFFIFSLFFIFFW